MTLRCCTHSPIAQMRGSNVCIVSSTRMPRSQRTPALRARSTSGWMPIATTTRSAASSLPSSSRTERTSVAPVSAAVRASRRTSIPRSAIDAPSSVAASRSSWRFINHGPWCTIVVCMPRARSPHAASVPSRPPPTTTARPPPSARRSIASTSSRLRKVSTPSSPRPGTSSSRGREPVAISRRSYGHRRPERAVTMRRTRSIDSTGSPAASVMPRLSYQARSWPAISSYVFSPVSRLESPMRL